MGRYLMRRILIAIPTFLGITILVYVLASMAPGSPLEMVFMDSNATAEAMADQEARLGLDQPIYIQYLRWFMQLLRGNFGVSFRTSLPVWDSIAERIGPTLLITISSIVVSICIAIPLGVMSAYKPYSRWDYFSSGLSFAGAATPNFFVGLMLIFLLSVKIHLFPSSGMYDSAGPHSFGGMVHHIVLPVLVLCLQQVGGLIRQTRSSMLEVLQDDFVRTALAPVVTMVGNMIPFIVGGAVVTEQLFSWPGLGSLMVLSINSRDYPVIMGITVFISVAVLIGNLIVDVIYSLLDPRVRYN